MTVAAQRSPLWRDRRFATYWVGQGISQFGDRITELTRFEVGVMASFGLPRILS